MELESELQRKIETLASRRVPREAGRESRPRSPLDEPPSLPDPTNSFDFVHLGEEIANRMVEAAEQQAKEAQHILEETRAFAQAIHDQVTRKATELVEMNARLKEAGQGILEAHRKFNAI